MVVYPARSASDVARNGRRAVLYDVANQGTRDVATPIQSSDGRTVILAALEDSTRAGDLRAAVGDDFRVVFCPPAIAATRQRELRASLVVIDSGMSPLATARACRRLRAASPAPVIVRGLSDDEADIALVLDAGADDCIPARVDTGELAARIRAVLRRAPPADDGCIDVGGLTIEPARHSVLVDGRDLALSMTEYALLEELARRADRVVPREDIISRLWATDADAGRRLRVTVSRLRARLQAAGAGVTIDSVAGVGYKLSAAGS